MLRTTSGRGGSKKREGKALEKRKRWERRGGRPQHLFPRISPVCRPLGRGEKKRKKRRKESREKKKGKVKRPERVALAVSGMRTRTQRSTVGGEKKRKVEQRAVDEQKKSNVRSCILCPAAAGARSRKQEKGEKKKKSGGPPLFSPGGLGHG